LVENRLTVRIKLGEFEVEVSGLREEVLSTLDSISEIVGKVSKAFTEAPIPSKIVVGAKAPVQAPVVEVELPSIKAPSGVTDAILKLLSTDWGRTPRTLKELVEAMEANAVYYSVGSISGTLTRLTKEGTVRRLKKDLEYAYVLTKVEGATYAP